MKIILVSGLWAPVDGNGLQALADLIQAQIPGTECKLIHWTDPLEDADIYIGHSYGVASIVKYLRTRELAAAVSLLVSLDGVPNWSFGQGQLSEWKISGLASRVLSYHRACFFPPWSSGLKEPIRGLDRDTFDFWASHNGIAKNEKYHQEIVDAIRGLA